MSKAEDVVQLVLLLLLLLLLVVVIFYIYAALYVFADGYNNSKRERTLQNPVTMITPKKRNCNKS